MRNHLKEPFRPVAAVLFALLAVLCLAAIPRQAYAKIISTGKGTAYEFYYSYYANRDPSKNIHRLMERGYFVNYYDLKQVKSTKSSVLSPSIWSDYIDEDSESEGYADGCIEYIIKKSGKAQLKYTYKGKKHVISYVVRKYTNPLASLKIGSKQYVKRFKHYSQSRDSSRMSFTGKIRVKAAKGWKINRIEAWDSSGSFVEDWYGNDTFGGSKRTVKNGSKVKNADGIYITVQHKNTGFKYILKLYANYEGEFD